MAAFQASLSTAHEKSQIPAVQLVPRLRIKGYCTAIHVTHCTSYPFGQCRDQVLCCSLL